MSDDPFIALRNVINEAHLRHARPPDQIRVNPDVPEGQPYAMALDEVVAAKRGIRWTPGATEILLAAADWDQMVDSVKPLRADAPLERVDDPPLRNPPTIYGLPVLFDDADGEQ